ncbi:hypothetical protein LZ32DRAFT_651895 [Colletotrichum eremochloae]|nr:hypothetical protein LZ32DRAFT_651895 [Colletotrichum eremochloae]
MSGVAGRLTAPFYKTDPKDLWESLHETGICHGSIFQNISRIRSSGQLSLCTFEIANTASIMPCSYESQHVVHPTTLDSAFQAAYAPLFSTGMQLKAALVPRRLKKLRVASALLNIGAGSLMHTQACLKKKTSPSFSTDLTVFGSPIGDDVPSTTPETLLEIKGLTFQSLGGSLSGRRPQSGAYSSWTWAPDITLADTDWLRNRLSVSVEPEEKVLMMDLRRCTIHFIVETRASVKARAVEGGVNGEILSRLGLRPLSMLRGEVEPLELMMEGRLLSRYYVEALKWNWSNTQASQLIKLLAHKNPRSRVLEVSGGTGGYTELILSALGDSKPVDLYDFTDISGGFFEPARERFERWRDVMTYSTLDIEKDLEV